MSRLHWRAGELLLLFHLTLTLLINLNVNAAPKPEGMSSYLRREKRSPSGARDFVVNNAQVDPQLQKVFTYIDTQRDQFIDDLKEAIAIASISSNPAYRPQVIQMVNFVAGKLEGLGGKVVLKDVGTETYGDGLVIPLPPILLASIGNNPSKKTVLVYGHLDVQPGKKDDGWDSEPFDMAVVDGKMIGRGATDDKGPVIGWIHVVQSYASQGIDLPVNIKFVFEAMEESGGGRLVETLDAETGPGKFLDGVDVVCISDSNWLGKSTPALTYGLRGLAYFSVVVEAGTKDLHSGYYGGAVHDALPDLIYLMNSLVDSSGKILIPGVMDSVIPLTPNEEAMYKKLDFELDRYKSEGGFSQLLHEANKLETIEGVWRNPSLNLHGIEGAFSDPGGKTVIPRKVIGKFSLRLVPNQEPDEIIRLVKDYLTKIWPQRNSKNRMEVISLSTGKPWLTDPNHPNYVAASKAVKEVYGVEPEFTRVGGSIPITLVLEHNTGKNVVLLPMGAGDDGAHSQNEKMNVRNFIEGTKVFAAYLWNIGQIKQGLGGAT